MKKEKDIHFLIALVLFIIVIEGKVNITFFRVRLFIRINRYYQLFFKVDFLSLIILKHRTC